jgi:predicted lipid-binding transport protein (Tim44 family)
MKRLIPHLLAAMLSAGLLAAQVDAKPLGAGRSSGMKRQTPAPQPTQPTPAKPVNAPVAATTPAPAVAPAIPTTPPKRSWMGPLAGLAAGLGIAALMSHFGMGAGMSGLFTALLLAGVAFVAVRFLMQRLKAGARAGSNIAPMSMALVGADRATYQGPVGTPSVQTNTYGGTAAGTSSALPMPSGEAAQTLERAAKLIFIRMQAANDAANLDDLRQFSTPEMFANFRLDLQERQGSAQQTDVVQLNAQVVDLAQENGQQIVSVRFHGLLREDRNAPTEPFDETWHLVKPLDGTREWAIAGIAQNASPAQ